jgi:four helix bundle protein
MAESGSGIAEPMSAMACTPPRDLGERTFLFACDIVQFCRKLSGEPGVVRQIAWQLADAGTSIAANYEEAKGSYSRREFAGKNSIVLKEARESRLWLRVIVACKLAQDVLEAQRLYDESNQLVGIFTAGVRRLRQPQSFTKTLLLAVFWFLLFSFQF